MYLTSDDKKSGALINLNSERKRCLRLFFIICWQQYFIIMEYYLTHMVYKVDNVTGQFTITQLVKTSNKGEAFARVDEWDRRNKGQQFQ